MADCEALIDAEFLHLTTGADISDSVSVGALIVVVSTLIGEELGACVAPAAATMKLRLVCAQYTSFVMSSGPGTGQVGTLRAEQIGDYRVEYNSTSSDSFNLQVLRDMLKSMNGSTTYSVQTTGAKVASGLPYFDVFDPGWDEVEDGERYGIADTQYGSIGLDEVIIP